MDPPDIPQENLRQAKLMRAELLIETNKPAIIQDIKDNHNIDLQIITNLSSQQTLHVRINLRHCGTEDVLNTVRCLPPTLEVVQILRQTIQEEVDILKAQLTPVVHIELTCWACGAQEHN